jgi:hypothetical protein
VLRREQPGRSAVLEAKLESTPGEQISFFLNKGREQISPKSLNRAGIYSDKKTNASVLLFFCKFL